MNQIPCCPGAIHAQIEYTNPNGMPIESLISIADLKLFESRKFLHDMLDEWLNRRVPGEGSDHFIVYGKWPAEGPRS